MIHHADDHLSVHIGDCREVLVTLPDESVHCVVTSPPYWGLRDYGTATWEGGEEGCDHLGPPRMSDKTGLSHPELKPREQILAEPSRLVPQPYRETCGKCGARRIDAQLGLEPTPEEYVANMVAVFREVRRVLRSDGTVWLNIGDSYAAGGQNSGSTPEALTEKQRSNRGTRFEARKAPAGLKPKDLVGIPWRLAFALQQPYYTGTIRDERDRIWLAAMLDAEGCLFIHKRKAGQHNGQGYYRTHDNYGPGVEIANTSLAVVERIRALVGKGSISTQGPDENARRKQTIYRWNLRTIECREFVRELYPHLVAKQQQARILIGCPSSGERAEAAHAALIALHRTGVSDVDFPAPASMFEPGWYLRSDVIWGKANPMPESVTDRPTKAHEYIFLLAKSARYFYDADAVREAPADYERKGGTATYTADGFTTNGVGSTTLHQMSSLGRNLRTVWTIATAPYPGAHFATFPPKLVEPCIKAGTSERGVCPECGAPWVRVVERELEATRGTAHPNERIDSTGMDAGAAWNHSGGVYGRYRVETTGWRPSCAHDAEPVAALVLDPFAGSGTTGMVAQHLGRRAILIDLSADYIDQAMARNAQAPLGLLG